MKFKYLVLILIFSFIATGVMAAEIQVAEKGNYNISIDEQVENLYAVGNIVSINDNVKKSLHAAGELVTINGDIEDNAYVGANTIIVQGEIGGSGHFVGSTILIEGNIQGDLFLAGSSVTLGEDSLINGDLYIASGVVEIKGVVVGNVRMVGGEIYINGEIQGKVDIRNSNKLKLGSNAKILKDLEYNSKEELSQVEGAEVLGEITFKKIEKNKSINFAKVLTSFFLLKILASIAVGLVLVYLMKGATKKIVNQGLNKFWLCLGLGLGALILIPIICIILAFSVIGIKLTGLIGLLYGLMIVLSSVLTCIVFGSWLIKIIFKQKEYLIDWEAVLVGVVLLSIIAMIPFIGWIVRLIFFLITLGAITYLFYRSIVLAK